MSLARFTRDLENQEGERALVGFLGHFSSGKSSLINALMGIKPNETPGYKRSTGRHPTDTAITLVCHRDYYERTHRSNFSVVDNVGIVYGPAIPLLEKVILVDTPGLGNEQSELEMVERFLHLCHVIIITLDSRRPFAAKDQDFHLLHLV